VEKTESLGPASYQQETIWISSWLQLHDIKHELKSDLVSLHTHQVWYNEDKTVDEFVTMDFFRFDNNGKIIEHWDSIQQIPEDSANSKTMY